MSQSASLGWHNGIALITAPGSARTQKVCISGCACQSGREQFRHCDLALVLASGGFCAAEGKYQTESFHNDLKLVIFAEDLRLVPLGIFHSYS